MRPRTGSSKRETFAWCFLRLIGNTCNELARPLRIDSLSDRDRVDPKNAGSEARGWLAPLTDIQRACLRSQLHHILLRLQRCPDQ